MPFFSKRIRILCALMAFNVVACVFLRFSFSTWQQPTQKARIPTQPFWHMESPSKSYWNRQQQILDIIRNPYVNSSLLPNDWLSSDPAASPDQCRPDPRIQLEITDYNLLPKLFQDYLLYFRCRSFPALINPEEMCRDRPFLLLVVKTLVSHFERRQAIRETWGRSGDVKNRTVVTLFLLGNGMVEDHHPNLTALLRHEAELYRDILQWDFRDSFLNLTLKDVQFLDWFSSFCPKAEFIFKGDDDVFVNTPRIVDFVDSLPPKAAADLFTGDVITNAGPHRDKKLKYFIPESYFVGSYPPYAGGGGFLYSGQVALKLSEASKQVVLYPIDDVYTGMCLKKLGLTPEKHDGFRTFDINAKHKDIPCIYRSLMVVHSRTPQEIKRIWSWIVQPDLQCQ